MKKIVENIFFGNYFYGICAVALCIEAGLQQQINLNSLFFYLIIFNTTVIYYSKAYIHVNDPHSHNPRIIWYHKHNRNILLLQKILAVLAFVYIIFYSIEIYQNNPTIFNDTNVLSPTFFLFLFLFPLCALLYYGLSTKGIGKYNLRNVGWLKPIIIGFTWAGLVTTYPVLFNSLEHSSPIKIQLVNVLLFIKNMMFVLVLSIMFDFKDYATDYNKKIKTFVVKFGLRKTIFLILLPLCIIGLGTFLTFGIASNFSTYKILLNTIPFICLLLIAYSMKNRRNILYYLVIIDGLMLLKAICGSIAMYYF